MTLVDTNVLLDLVTDDPVWSDWSIAASDTAAVRGPLLINDVIYAALSVHMRPSLDCRCQCGTRCAIANTSPRCAC
ncbi:MAG: hypothetical protein AB7S57_10735 [Acetobacteraceae bacterium]